MKDIWSQLKDLEKSETEPVGKKVAFGGTRRGERARPFPNYYYVLEPYGT